MAVAAGAAVADEDVAVAGGAAAGVVVAGLGVAAAAEGVAAYQVCTPLCPRHAPLLDLAVEYVPSLHCPVAPAGCCA